MLKAIIVNEAGGHTPMFFFGGGGDMEGLRYVEFQLKSLHVFLF